MHPINISRTTVQHMCNWKGIQILTIWLISKGLLFFIHPVYSSLQHDNQLSKVLPCSNNTRMERIERLHSFPWDQLNKNHGGHVGVPDKKKSLIKIILNWNTNMAAVTSCANALYTMNLKCIWHEISYFLKWKNPLSCSVTYFSVSCVYGLFTRYFNLFDM
jgi:hypothetical protein